MMQKPETAEAAVAKSTSERANELFREQQRNIILHTDRMFAWLMLFQWFFGIGAAVLFSPQSWTATESRVHPNVWGAIFLGALITVIPAVAAFTRPGTLLTRYTVGVGQMLMSALLIHLMGGRIETHFHVFGSLAILAFYRDWRVLMTASAVIVGDHFIRGLVWPESVYGVVSASIWRTLEHGGWILFELTFLLIAIHKSLAEMRLVAERQARLEFLKNRIEQTVAERTADLLRENQERRLTEEQLKRSQAQLAQAQQIANMGSWEWDLVENKVFWSAQTQRLYGREPGDLGEPMQSSLDLVHPDDRERVNAIMAEALRTGNAFVCEHRVLLRDGSERIMQGRGEILKDDQGKAVKMFGVVQDITDSKRAEELLKQSHEQLRQSQKMEAVGRLAGGIAHDFNNLLTVIGGYCAFSLKETSPNSQLHRNIAEIQKAAERAASLTGQLLAFSRKQVLQPRVIQLNDIVRNMEKMLRRLIGEDVELQTAFDGLLGNVKADPGQLEQVIMNLVVNARDAMPRGGKLTISTENVSIDHESRFRNRSLEPGEYVMLAVSDNGIGMTDEIKAHLFEPFFTTKGLGKGTGLGLATCYGIVVQSGGDIRVYSEPNFGTTFKIYLPRTGEMVRAADRESDAFPRGTERILVVEDDPSVRELTVAVLQERGYQVHESNNAFEALEVLRTSKSFDLILSDVIMPRMSGKELSDQIRNQQIPVKVLLMSGYTDDALAHHGVLDESISFLAKPFSPAQLTRKIREVLDRPGDLQPVRLAPRVRDN